MEADWPPGSLPPWQSSFLSAEEYKREGDRTTRAELAKYVSSSMLQPRARPQLLELKQHCLLIPSVHVICGYDGQADAVTHCCRAAVALRSCGCRNRGATA